MTPSALICLAHGSEEIEAVTTIDLLVRAGISVTIASTASDGELVLTCSRGVKLVADVPLEKVIDESFDAIILPGGMRGAECFRDNSLVIEKIRQAHYQRKIIAAICAVPAIVLEHHNLFPTAKMTGYPGLQDKISSDKWIDCRVCFDDRVNLLTSQGPATAFDFALKLIELLKGREIAAEVAAQLILPLGVYSYQD
ncbi:protein deglycase YajL [Photorhabdus hindustanensis]|uniref:Protein deglycase YajL n=1 Tax=Photorhabdus hindustanensis TaxID=2918802 RepID=A0A2S8Q9N2_9GAMM|nr:protein deglycase YajL [Photorhabdus hindustanensis]PQQ29957.1 protein deglycase YajL [Photorhabdus hindustanensis]